MPVGSDDKGTHIEYYNSGTGDSILRTRLTNSGTLLAKITAGGFLYGGGDGDATEPDICPDATDPDTGLFRQSANALAAASGGVEIWRGRNNAGSGVANLLLSVNQDGSVSVKGVSLGAHDSGGSGYRLLRVPTA